MNGRIFFQALWFQNILIYTTLVISIIVLSFKKQYLLIFLYIILFSYILQYSYINYYFFKEHFGKKYYLTYGRVVEAFPNIISGFYLHYLDMDNKIKDNRKNTIIISLLTLIFLSKSRFDNHLLSFKYGGIRRNMASICIFLIFLSFPSNKITNNKIENILKIITSYTAGIYFSHCLLGRGEIIKLILNKNLHTIFGCLSIYLICFTLCFILDKLFGKTFLRHLFK